MGAQETAKPTITADEIADLLHMKTETFLKRRRKLTAAGMPRPVPGLELLWSRALIMAWIDRDTRERSDWSGASGLEESVEDEAGAATGDYIATARRALEARAGVGQ